MILYINTHFKKPKTLFLFHFKIQLDHTLALTNSGPKEQNGLERKKV